MKTVVIVGSGHAAPDAISTLRRSGWEGRIVLLGDEPHLPYQRPPLSKGYFDGGVEKEKLVIRNTAFYEKNNVELKLSCRVVEINRAKFELILDDGEILYYDKLILATGTRPRSLQAKGLDQVKAHYLRTVDDVDRIKSQVKSGGRLLIIGAGYIGLELASSAVKNEVKVTVLESMERVLARVTGVEVSEFYQDIHAQAGVDIRLNTCLDYFAQTDDGSVAVLVGGEILAFDVVVIGIGVVPNSELAQQAGLECGDGVVVNEFTQTSDPNIYAVGDVSNHPSLMYKQRLRLESVPNTVAQAKVAASHICGKEIVHDQLPWFWSDQYDIKLQTAGLFQGYDTTQIQGDMDQRKFSVSYFKENKLIAIDALNSPADFMKAKKKIIEDLSNQ